MSLFDESLAKPCQALPRHLAGNLPFGIRRRGAHDATLLGPPSLSAYRAFISIVPAIRTELVAAAKGVLISLEAE